MRVVRGVAVASVFALAAWLAVRAHVDARVAAALGPTTGEPPPWLELCVARRDADAGVVERRESAATAHVLFALARMLAPGDRRALTTALDGASELWEARANPLVEDVTDGSPDEGLRAWLATAPGAVGVARTAARDVACGGDGLCMRVVARDRDGGFASPCPAPFVRAEDARVRARARFLLWPWGYALTFRAKDARAAGRAADRLRAAARAPGSPDARIALVFAGDDARADDEDVVQLEKALERHVEARAAAKAREALDWESAARSLAEARRARVPDVLGSMRSDEIVVMPFLDGIGRLEEVAAAVAQVAPELERIR